MLVVVQVFEGNFVEKEFDSSPSDQLAGESHRRQRDGSRGCQVNVVEPDDRQVRWDADSLARDFLEQP